MKNLNLLLTLPLIALFIYPAEARSESPVGEPPVAVVIKTPAGKVKHKKRKKIVKVVPKPVECPKCAECPSCPAPVECPTVQCPTPEECALTVPEAISRKNDLDIYFGFTLNKQKSDGLNKFGLDSWLTSPWSLGLLVGTSFYPTESFSIFTNYTYSGMAFANAQPGIILQQQGQTYSKWDIGTKYAFSRLFNAQLHLGLQQDYTLYVTTLPYATVDEFWHGFAGMAFGYHIWQNKKTLSFDGDTGFDVYFPNTKTGYKASTGYGINTDLKMTIKYKPEFFVSFRYEYFKTNPSNFMNQYGQNFMFCFGVDFRSKVLRSDFWNRN
jgi:hypothetical protein